MARQTGKRIDWWTVTIYLALMVIGWFSVCSACYSYGDTNFLDTGSKAFMQIIWIGTAIILAAVIFSIPSEYYETFSVIVYLLFLLLLIATIFNPHEIKGSRSWLVLGPLRLQPAELAKFAVALCLAKVMGTQNFNITRPRHAFLVFALTFLPMLCIVAQKETGSALVYLAFFLVFYREGLSGSILFTGVAFIIYFVVGIKYSDVQLSITHAFVGKFVVLLLVQLFTGALTLRYLKDKLPGQIMLLSIIIFNVLLLLFGCFVIPFDITWAQLFAIVILAGYLLYQWLFQRLPAYLLLALFALSSTLFYYSVDYTMNNVLQIHQRTRINVLLGVEEDLKGAGYNVHQSEIAIGSGGLSGKGFLNGTQTKLKYVPEKETDFIFCTIGEEFGFMGSAVVLLLYLLLILRLIYLAERQPFAFGRVYGYCVLSVFLFHLIVNVGMVIGLAPVIGIPLPFISYGGSSLWGFTLLLFIFLKIDAERTTMR